MTINGENKNYIYDLTWDDNDNIGRLLQQMPKAAQRMHKMDGGKYMSFADANLMVFLHKLGLRGKPRVSD